MPDAGLQAELRKRQVVGPERLCPPPHLELQQLHGRVIIPESILWLDFDRQQQNKRIHFLTCRVARRIVPYATDCRGSYE